MNLMASLIIAIGLPTGLYLSTIYALEHLNNLSSDVGKGLIDGIQYNINHTLFENLAQRISHSIIIGAVILPEDPGFEFHPPRGR
jgi:hypothetical protein